MTAAARSLAAEVRAVEEGHHAWLGDDGFEVVSDHQGDGVRYQVTVADVAGLLRFTCDHPTVRHLSNAPATTVPGLLACKHAGVVAHRLEREGLAVFAEDRWSITDKARRLAAQPAAAGYGLDSDDPFVGLPR